MKIRRSLLAILATVFALGMSGPAPAHKRGDPHLVALASYDTGLGANGAEIISLRDDGMAVLTNVAGSIDVLDLSEPASPRLVRRIEIGLAGGTPNSAAIHPQRDYFLVVVGTPGQVGKVLAYRLDGTFLASAAVGIQPDSVAIAPNGKYAVVANEAEGTGTGANGGAGSLSVVDLDDFRGRAPAPLVITQVALPSQAGVAGFSTGRTDDLARLPVDNTPETLEPESVAFSRDSRYAYVTLQENSGVVRLELRSGELTFFGLGQTSHLADLTTTDNTYLPLSSLTAYREPDGIAVDPRGNFFVTADEGDTRNGAGASGPRGGRTVSVFDARSGALFGDTGSQLDDAAAAAGLYPDARSNRGGSEPEGLDLTQHRGKTLVAVGLERANAVALVDVTQPASPRVVDIMAVGSNPEGIKFLHRKGRLYVVTANEVAGTVSVLEVVH